MICAVLAAGYATRLYPLTENFPKPLLKVGDRTILDWLLADIDSSCDISSYVIISNHKFVSHFENWANDVKLSAPVTVIDDGSVSNETRLGAVRDVQFAIEKCAIDDDMMVIAGDNVLDFSLGKFKAYFDKAGTSCMLRYHEPDMKRLKKSGVLLADENDRVVRMEEKPAEPFAEWCAPPFYIYKKSDLPLVNAAINDGCNVDAPGSFMAYLSAHTPVHAMVMPGKRFDIGNLESYNQACADYRGITEV